ncbi:MAG: Gmad2 immunoglobulin-like domain-containing protein [Actinomycetota bacterium]
MNTLRRQAAAVMLLTAMTGLASACSGGEATPTTAVPLPHVHAAAITVSSPESDAAISGPVSVSGTASIKDGQIIVELQDGSKGILAAMPLGSPKSGVRGVYNVALDYQGGHQGPAVVAVYAISPYDGSHVHEVDVPVVLRY